MQPSKQLSGHIAAFFTIFVWAITFINTKVLLVDFSAVEIMFFRLALALVALFIISPPRLRWVKPDRSVLQTEWKIMAAGLCGVTLYFLFQNFALTYTQAANVSVLVSVAPLFTALACWLFLGEKLKGNFFLGFALAITGIILVTFNGRVVLKVNPLGDLLSLLAPLSWAFYNLLIKMINSQEKEIYTLTRKVFTYGFLFMLPALPLTGFRPGLERFTVLPNALHMLFLGLVASALCYLTWNYAVHILGPVKTTVYIYMVPIITIIASVLALDEKITLVSGVGMALIILGMALSERGKASS